MHNSDGYRSKRSNFAGMALAFAAGAAAWAMFGGRIRRRMNENRRYREIRDRIMERAGRIREMSQDRYNEIVDDISSSYGKAKGISEVELRDMVRDLKGHWARIKDRWRRPDDDGY